MYRKYSNSDFDEISVSDDFFNSNDDQLDQIRREMEQVDFSENDGAFFDFDDYFSAPKNDSLNGVIDDNWNDMLTSFNDDMYDMNFSGNSYSESRRFNRSRESDYDNSRRRFHDSDDLSDDQNDFSNDDFSDDDFSDDGFPEDMDENDFDSLDYAFSETDETPRKSSTDKNLVLKLIVVSTALIFGIGVMFFIKFRHASDENGFVSYDDGYGYVTRSDYNQETVSDQPDDQPDSTTDESLSSQDDKSEQENQTTYKELKHKDKNYDVLKMQNRLCELGYITQKSCTGYFGDFTLKKLKEFQKAAGLEQTGIADSETLTKLYSKDAPKAK